MIRLMSVSGKDLRNPNYWGYILIRGTYLLHERHRDQANYVRNKRELLEELVKGVKVNSEVENNLESIKNALLCNNFELREIEMRALSPVLIGASENFGKLAYEVGMYFDPIFNVPYIPGSSIKGAVRAAVFDLTKKDGENDEKADELCKEIFGDNLSAGLVGFTDAYPIEAGEQGYLLYPDVMTPHYGEGVSTELDVSPNPIVFLTIAPGAKFRFYMFFRRERKFRYKGKEVVRSINNKISNEPKPSLNELRILDRGLLYAFIKGVGAKTAVGYSKFGIVKYEPVKE